jgi:hypothetical protein
VGGVGGGGRRGLSVCIYVCYLGAVILISL